MVRVEFYGIPRNRAGVDSLDVPAGRLHEVLASVALKLPRLADECFSGDKLKAGYLACINGLQFTTDGESQLNNGDALLILSADVGG